MRYYRDMREHLEMLEKRGKLIRIEREINKDTEMHPLMRLQFRGLPEEQRKAFIFEKVTDNRGRHFSVPVACCMLGASKEIYSIGLMCEPDEISDKWVRSQLNPIKPVIVPNGPVQEVVFMGADLLKNGGLDEFPIPISTPGYDPGPFMSSPYIVTRDPDTGVNNIGTYRVQIKSPTRTGANFAPMDQKDAGGHWLRCREKGIPLQAAIVIGLSLIHI